MDLNFISCSDLYNPQHKIDKGIIFDHQPFYNDFYIIIYLKKTLDTYREFLMADHDLVLDYGGDCLADLVEQVLVVQSMVHSLYSKEEYRILVLKNGWWCLYIERYYIWDKFKSIGVVNVISPSRTALLDYFQKKFAMNLS